MTTAVQVQYRRGTSSQVASFTGAQGELVVDTTNNRVVVQDGATGGGYPAAKLAEVVTNSRTQVNDASYTALATDRTIAFIALTAARTVTLPAASSFPTGTRLLVMDESGACSATNTISLAAAGSDLIDGAASAVINSGYGYLALQSNGLNKWTIVDQAAGASSAAAPSAGGYVNKFRNGTMDVWQRGTSGTATTTAGASTQTAADGWYVVPTGASATWSQQGGRLLTKNSLQVTGATSVTDIIVKQRIESLIAAAFCSQTVTVQAQVYNGSGASITPTLTVKHAGSQDVWTSPTTDVSAAALQACLNGAWTLVAYTFAASANSYNGIEVSFDFGNNFGANTKTVQIAECDIRVTSGAAAGQNASPPPPELRPITCEFELCQRYYVTTYGNGVTPGSSAGLGGMITIAGMFLSGSTYYAVGCGFPWPTPMRAAPTLSRWDALGNSGKSSMWLGGPTNNEFDNQSLGGTFVITANGFFYKAVQSDVSAEGAAPSIHYAASAEL